MNRDVIWMEIPDPEIPLEDVGQFLNDTEQLVICVPDFKGYLHAILVSRSFVTMEIPLEDVGQFLNDTGRRFTTRVSRGAMMLAATRSEICLMKFIDGGGFLDWTTV